MVKEVHPTTIGVNRSVWKKTTKEQPVRNLKRIVNLDGPVHQLRKALSSTFGGNVDSAPY